MARISVDQAEQYKSNGGSEFFSIKNDKESVPVRFLYKTIEEFDLYLVHEVMIAGKKRWVECLREDCPICNSGKRPQLKMFIQLIDGRDNKLKTWERGQNFLAKMQSVFRRYGAEDLSATPFEVERNGKPNDKDTTYEVYALPADGKNMKDFPERQELLGEFILVKTAAEMEGMVNGTYTEADNTGAQNSYTPNPADTSKRERIAVPDEEVF